MFMSVQCLASGSPADPSAQPCLNYEPAQVTLTGNMSRKTLTNVSGQKETIWILHLAEPVCVNKGTDDFDVRRAKVTDVQLAVAPEMYTKYRGLLSKAVNVSGTLFGEQTQHHFTPVLLLVKEIRAAR